MQGGRICEKVGAKRMRTAILTAFVYSKGKHFQKTPAKKVFFDSFALIRCDLRNDK